MSQTLVQATNNIMKRLILTEGVGRAVASDLTTLTRNRIFDKGIASDGSPIGEYTDVTVSLKKQAGRFTSTKVNLRDTGKLANSYGFSCSSDKCSIGFFKISRGDGKTNAQLRNELEEHFKKSIWALTSDEKKEINNIVKDYLDRIF